MSHTAFHIAPDNLVLRFAIQKHSNLLKRFAYCAELWFSGAAHGDNGFFHDRSAFRGDCTCMTSEKIGGFLHPEENSCWRRQRAVG
jgi:hypothetical protein